MRGFADEPQDERRKSTVDYNALEWCWSGRKLTLTEMVDGILWDAVGDPRIAPSKRQAALETLVEMALVEADFWRRVSTPKNSAPKKRPRGRPRANW